MAPTVSLIGQTTRVAYTPPRKPAYSSWLGAARYGYETYITFVEVWGAARPRVGDLEWAGVEKRFRRMVSIGGSQFREADSFGESFNGPPHAYSGQAYTILSDGTEVHRVNYEDLQAVDKTYPATAGLRFRKPGEQWSAPVFPLDPEKVTANFSRIYVEPDGSLLVTGNQWKVPAGTRTRTTRNEWCMVRSRDGGATWQDVLPNPGRLWGNEWASDVLPNGDRLAVFRTRDPDTNEQVRRVGRLLRQEDGTYSLLEYPGTPFPHSGHPEVLSLAGGQVVLHISSTGTHYTTDEGKTWQPLAGARTLYYPKAIIHGVEGDTWDVRVYSHKGGDNDYGEVEQFVQEQYLKLSITGLTNPREPEPEPVVPEPEPEPPAPEPEPEAEVIPHGTMPPSSPLLYPPNGTRFSHTVPVTYAIKEPAVVRYEYGLRTSSGENAKTPTLDSPNMPPEGIMLPKGRWTVKAVAFNTAGASPFRRRDYEVY